MKATKKAKRTRRRGAGEGTIFEESPGKWRAVVSLGFRNGKRIRKAFTAGSMAEVQAKLTKARHDNQIGINVAPEKQTLGAWLETWLETHVRPSTKPNTYTFYSCIIHNWITPNLGTVALQKLTPTRIQDFLNDRLAAGLSPSSVRSTQRTLRTALKAALKFGYLNRNVATLLDSVHVPKRETGVLNPVQARTFLEVAELEPLGPLFVIMLTMALRPGEAAGLRWQDIDLESGRVNIRMTLQWIKRKGEKKRRATLVEAKTSASRRTLKLPALAKAALVRYKVTQAEEEAWAADRWSGNPSGLVFTNTLGNPLDEKKVYNICQRILKAAKLPKVRTHDLRHSAASILIAQGVGPKAISAQLGHSSVSFTLQTYGHLFDESKQQTADAMDAALNPVATSVATSAAEKVQ